MILDMGRWSKIAAQLPGRTDNEIKNYWNTHIKKKLRRMGIDPVTHQPLDNVLPQTHQSKPASANMAVQNNEAELGRIEVQSMGWEKFNQISHNLSEKTDMGSSESISYKWQEELVNPNSVVVSEETGPILNDVKKEEFSDNTIFELGIQQSNLLFDEKKFCDKETACKEEDLHDLDNGTPLLYDYENLWEFTDFAGCPLNFPKHGESGMHLWPPGGECFPTWEEPDTCNNIFSVGFQD
eukprot:Gb_27494 [translate_table: standard]